MEVSCVGSCSAQRISTEYSLNTPYSQNSSPKILLRIGVANYGVEKKTIESSILKDYWKASKHLTHTRTAFFSLSLFEKDKIRHKKTFCVLHAYCICMWYDSFNCSVLNNFNLLWKLLGSRVEIGD